MQTNKRIFNSVKPSRKQNKTQRVVGKKMQKQNLYKWYNDDGLFDNDTNNIKLKDNRCRKLV